MLNKLNDNEIIICDWDGVMQLFDDAIIVLTLHNENFFKKYDIDISFFKQNNVLYKLMNRKEYYINNLYKNLNIPWNILYEYCFNNKNFYNISKFTNISTAIFNLVQQKFCKSLHFLTLHNLIYTASLNSKVQNMLKFKQNLDTKTQNKITFNILDIDNTKSAWINKYQPNYTVMIDDNPKIITDIIEHTDSCNKLFLVPKFGYNITYYDKFVELSKKYNCEISYMDINI